MTEFAWFTNEHGEKFTLLQDERGRYWLEGDEIGEGQKLGVPAIATLNGVIMSWHELAWIAKAIADRTPTLADYATKGDYRCHR